MTADLQCMVTYKKIAITKITKNTGKKLYEDKKLTLQHHLSHESITADKQKLVPCLHAGHRLQCTHLS